MNDLMPRKGAIALCGRGQLGLITSVAPHPVEYTDAKTALSWTGIHLGLAELGKPWSSRTPKVLGYIEDLHTVIERTSKLLAAVHALYYSAIWTADRPVDAAKLWTDVRDAAGFIPGQSPKPLT